ncbi:MAG: hypothetical protein V1749_03160 [Candidatus Desantisbacteria bacterium]
MYRFQNLVVTANPIKSGSEIVLQCPKPVAKLATRFLESLPS